VAGTRGAAPEPFFAGLINNLKGLRLYSVAKWFP
jgi:hypothetical protein